MNGALKHKLSQGVIFMRTRLGDAQDWPFIYELSKTAILSSISPWRIQTSERTLSYREGMLKGFWKWIQQTGSLILIAEAEQEGQNLSVGYLILYLEARDEFTGLKQGWIMDLAVLPTWRRKGVGRLLMDAAERHCREAGLEYLGLAVTSTNERALQLYQDIGFAEERKLMLKVLK